ncbi:unnamed protein product [Penicillium bialowiezense]
MPRWEAPRRASVIWTREEASVSIGAKSQAWDRPASLLDWYWDSDRNSTPNIQAGEIQPSSITGRAISQNVGPAEQGCYRRTEGSAAHHSYKIPRRSGATDISSVVAERPLNSFFHPS